MDRFRDLLFIIDNNCVQSAFDRNDRALQFMTGEIEEFRILNVPPFQFVIFLIDGNFDFPVCTHEGDGYVYGDEIRNGEHPHENSNVGHILITLCSIQTIMRQFADSLTAGFTASQDNSRMGSDTF